MIRYGPAGIPLSCKGRTLKDGIEDVHNLALTAMEIQMVRPNCGLRAPEDEEVGKSIAELGPDSGFVVAIERGDEGFDYNPDAPIGEEDSLLYMDYCLAACYADLYRLGDMARRHDVALSVHTPYYMRFDGELYSDEEDEYGNPIDTPVMRSFTIVQNCATVLNALGGNLVVTNLGPYGEENEKRSKKEVVANLKELKRWWKSENLSPKLGIEITGHEDVWGSIDEVFDICKNRDLKGFAYPVLNFAHYQARSGDALSEADDYADLIERFEPFYKDLGNVYADFSNVESDGEGNEKWYTPVKKGEIKFEKLAEALADNMPAITMVSDSPLLEHDAVYMRTLTERVLSKKAAKQVKERKRQEEKKAEDDGELAPADPHDEEE
jgi:deoxyribonuclease-4